MKMMSERIKRYLLFFSGLFECFGFVGLIYGWPSLVLVLKNKAYFADLCPSVHNSSDSGARNVTDCAPQDERLTLIFTIASFTMPLVSVINGVLLDYYGTMAARFLSIFLYAAATLMIAFSTAASAFLLFPALPLLGAAGILLFMTNMQVGNLFGSKRSTVITLYNGAFDSSAVVFLVVKLFHEVGLSLRVMFLFISCLLVLLILRTIFLLPRAHIPYPLPEGYTYRVNCGFCAVSSNNRSSQQGAEEMWENQKEREDGTQRDIGNERGDSKGKLGVGCEETEVEVRGKQKETGGDILKASTKTERNTGEGRVEMEEEQKDVACYLEKPKGEKERGAGERSEEIDLEQLTQFTEEDTREKTNDNEIEKRTGTVEAEGNDGESREPPIDDGNLQLSGPGGSEPQEKEEAVVSFWSCVFSRLFLTDVLWISLIQLRLLLFIGTLNPMLNFLAKGDPRNVSKFTNAFGIIQLCGILCAPWNGLILDRHKRKRKHPGSSPDSASSQRLADMQSAVLSLAITVTLAVLFSISATIPVLEVQYLTFILQMVTRAFLYGGNSAFIALAFPMCHFGKLFGTSLALAAVVSLLQFPCIILVNGALQSNPLYINIAFTVLVTVAYAHPVAVYIYCRRESHRGTREENRNAEELPAQE